MRIKLKMAILEKMGSQANLARACHKHDEWISKIVMGRKRPTEKDRKMILEKLGLPEDQDDLFGERECA